MIRIEALGGLRILVDDQESVVLAKQRLKCGLLVFLAVERSVMRETLIATFWPDREPDRARHALSQTIYELRKLLGEDWLNVSGDRLTVADSVCCDAIEFVAAVESGALHTAMKTFGGTFLEGCYLAETPAFEQWIDRRQDRIHKLLRRALREASQLEDRPEWIELAIDVARHAVERDSTDDDAQHALLQLLVRAGRRSEALKQFEKYEAALAPDGLEPLEHTKQLIAVARETQEPADAPRVFPLPEPQRVFPGPEQTFDWPDEPVMVPLPFHRRVSRRGALIVAGLALAAVTASAWWWNGPARNKKASGPESATPRIAVLYFTDRSHDSSFTFFANALTEGLIYEFSRVQGLEVRSKEAVKYYRDRNLPQDSLVRGLNVDYVVHGEVTTDDNDQLRIGVQLENLATRAVKGGDPLRRPADSLQDLRDDVVEQVATLLRQEIGRDIEAKQRRQETRSQRAFELYLRAKQQYEEFVALLLSRGGLDGAEAKLNHVDSLLATAETLDRSWNAPIVLRGRFATMRAQVTMHRRGPGAKAEIRQSLDEAVANASRAIRREPDDAEAWETRGIARYRIWFTRATRDDNEFMALRDSCIADLRKATDLDSLRVEAQSALSEVYNQLGRFSEARVAAKRAYHLDRYYSGAQNTLFRLAIATFEDGLDDEALDWCKEGQRRFPQSHQFLDCRLRLLAWGSTTRPEDVDSAKALLSRVSNLHRGPSGQDPSTLFRFMAASIYARANRRQEALTLLAPDQSGRTPDKSSLWIEAAARARLNQRDSAVSLVQRFLAIDPAILLPILKSRALTPLLTDSRFMELSKKVAH
jgi:DNA-binding SARP family transcriptional activator/TolB-like protein